MNLMADREMSELERETARQQFEIAQMAVRRERLDAQNRGLPPEQWPPEPTLVIPLIRGISVATGKAVISAVAMILLVAANLGGAAA